MSGVKKIRLHDLLHSHASLLISKLGAQPNLVAERLGHEKINTTLNIYSHLYPNQSRDLADQLNNLQSDEIEEDGYQEFRGDCLALAVTVVDILNGAAYLFDKNPENDNQHWKADIRLDQLGKIIQED